MRGSKNNTIFPVREKFDYYIRTLVALKWEEKKSDKAHCDIKHEKI